MVIDLDLEVGVLLIFVALLALAEEAEKTYHGFQQLAWTNNTQGEK